MLKTRIMSVLENIIEWGGGKHTEEPLRYCFMLSYSTTIDLLPTQKCLLICKGIDSFVNLCHFMLVQLSAFRLDKWQPY